MRFLCLHGMGSNSQVFESQTAAVRYELGDDHTYEFAEGCVPTGPSPDLVAMASPEQEYFAYSDAAAPASILQTFHHLNSYVDAQGPFDGVLAFSEGAALAASYMAWRVRQDPAREKAKPTFKLAVLFSSLNAVDVETAGCIKGSRPLLSKHDGELIQIPTVHIWGRKDGVTAAVHVSGICQSDIREVYLHDGGHEVPGPAMVDAIKETVRLIRRAVISATNAPNVAANPFTKKDIMGIA